MFIDESSEIFQCVLGRPLDPVGIVDVETGILYFVGFVVRI
jgi:hypothetical protein